MSLIVQYLPTVKTPIYQTLAFIYARFSTNPKWPPSNMTVYSYNYNAVSSPSDRSRTALSSADPIRVNRPAIVREIPHFGLFSAFPHFRQNVPHFWLYFEITQIVENLNNVSCAETFCPKKLCRNVSDSVT